MAYVCLDPTSDYMNEAPKTIQVKGWQRAPAYFVSYGRLNGSSATGMLNIAPETTTITEDICLFTQDVQSAVGSWDVRAEETTIMPIPPRFGILWDVTEEREQGFCSPCRGYRISAFTLTFQTGGKPLNTRVVLPAQQTDMEEGAARSAEDFIRDIEKALKDGAFVLARQLSAKGAECYPDHSELRKYAHVFAPPSVIRNDLPPTPSVRANRDWLEKHGKHYGGRWVALRNGDLISLANSFDELVEQVGETKGVLLTKIPQ